ncbi:MAG TPA: ParA family partition ATPase [Rickettsiales bacterium]|nr:ParA family partition ATPase [Rickettsiales bacterium]
MESKVITIAQQKGGAGKTTVAIHLAVAWKQRGFRVAVIDIDPQGSLTQWHKIREKCFGEGYTGLTFSTVSGWRVGSEIARLKRNHDIILIDSPPHTETEARTAIRNADFIIVPVQPSPTDLWATKATLEIAKSENVPVRVVLNRISASSKLAQTIAAELPNLAKSHLGNRVLFAASIMEGRSATEVGPSTPAALEVKALAEEITKLAKLGVDDQEEYEEEELETTA